MSVVSLVQFQIESVNQVMNNISETESKYDIPRILIQIECIRSIVSVIHPNMQNKESGTHFVYKAFTSLLTNSQVSVRRPGRNIEEVRDCKGLSRNFPSFLYPGIKCSFQLPLRGAFSLLLILFLPFLSYQEINKYI